MKKISCIVCWPDGFDFPIFRKNISKLQEHVSEIVVCFTKHGNYSLREWLKQNMPVTFLNEEDSRYSGDWRNKATNHMIDNLSGEWVLSLEQDFFIKDYSHFFNTVNNSRADVVTFRDNDRFHPAFMLVKRFLFNKTTRNFGVVGQDKDHFWKFSSELGSFADAKTIFLDDLYLKHGEDWDHLGGLTENYFAPKPYYELNNFYAYNEACKQIPSSFHWMGVMERCTGEYKDAKIERFL